MLTPSLKLKRRNVWQTHGDKVEKLYGAGGKAETRAQA